MFTSRRKSVVVFKACDRAERSAEPHIVDAVVVDQHFSLTADGKRTRPITRVRLDADAWPDVQERMVVLPESAVSKLCKLERVTLNVLAIVPDLWPDRNVLTLCSDLINIADRKRITVLGYIDLSVPTHPRIRSNDRSYAIDRHDYANLEMPRHKKWVQYSGYEHPEDPNRLRFATMTSLADLPQIAGNEVLLLAVAAICEHGWDGSIDDLVTLAKAAAGD